MFLIGIRMRVRKWIERDQRASVEILSIKREVRTLCCAARCGDLGKLVEFDCEQVAYDANPVGCQCSLGGKASTSLSLLMCCMLVSQYHTEYVNDIRF